jgi:UDP-glucose 4-epimerase
MRYLVTGGAGFIGSHIVDHLMGQGNQVLVVDDFSTGDPENLAIHKASKDLEVIEGNILDSALIKRATREVDRVFHFAAAVGVFNIMSDTVKSLKTNLQGTENVLEACLEYKKPVLIASSSEVYGKNGSDSLSEDSDRIIGPPQKIRWSYSDAKAIDESLAISLHREQGLEARIVRLFNTVGPRQVGRYGMVFPRFVEAALKGEALTIYGSGEQTRCFGHVLDIVDAILKIESTAEAIACPVNIGVSEEISILNLASRVLRLLNSKSTVKFVPYEEVYSFGFEDMQRRVPDNALLKKLTGWRPKRGIEQIVLDIANHINK